MFSEESDATHPEASPAGRFRIDATFINQGKPLTDLFFVVTELRSEAPTLLHHLLNADDPPGQEGATVTIANDALPGGNGQWDRGESVPILFEVGLMERRRFAFTVELYSSAVPTAQGGSTFLGRFVFNYDPAQTPTASRPQIFLPIIQRSGTKPEYAPDGGGQAICWKERCLTAYSQ